MLGLILLGCIVVWIVNYLKDKDHQKRRELSHDIISQIDYHAVLHEHYLGSYGFGEPHPAEDLEYAIVGAVDQGIENRLTFLLAETTPKWMLVSAVNALKASSGHGNTPTLDHIEAFLWKYAEQRTQDIKSRLVSPSTTRRNPEARRRRRR